MDLSTEIAVHFYYLAMFVPAFIVFQAVGRLRASHLASRLPGLGHP